MAGGTPTLTLNDGGTATYTGGSGSSALTFSYTVGGRAEHVRPGGDGGQSQYGDRQGWCRQCRQSHRRGDQPGRHPADRHHGADGGCDRGDARRAATSMPARWSR